jgi:uncharacterized protein DUF4128
MPLDTNAAVSALRARAMTLSVATTGAATLSATATGYARTTGSFIADGIMVGMEVVPGGFTQTDPGFVTEVSALALRISGGRAVQAAGAGRTLSVGLPPHRAWENETFKPIDGRWHVEEDSIPGDTRVLAFGTGAPMDEDPQYRLKLFSPAGWGSEAITRVADALLALYAPRTVFTLAGGDALRVRDNPAPFRSRLGVSEGRAMIAVTVPLRVRTALAV